MADQSTQGQRWYGTGRRKSSTARVWITLGNGTITVNHRTIEDYFGRETLRMILQQPLDITQNVGKIDIRVNVRGGGLSGQAGAIRHGLARALLAMHPASRPDLKKADTLRRDPRKVERKKYGRSGARKRFQFSKR